MMEGVNKNERQILEIKMKNCLKNFNKWNRFQRSFKLRFVIYISEKRKMVEN